MGKILVTDDEAAILGLVTEILLDAGHEVSVAFGGGEAISLAAELNPDVILLDWMMPDADGREVAETLRKHGSNAKVILVSAVPDIHKKAASIAADGYVEKPFCIDDLMDAVERCLQS